MNKILLNYNDETVTPCFSPEFAPKLTGETGQPLGARLSEASFESWTDAEWLAYGLIDDLASLRIMTGGQMLRWFQMRGVNLSLREIKTTMAELFRAGLLGIMRVEVPFPLHKRHRKGQNKLQMVEVVFLTEGSASTLKGHPQFRFFRFGRLERQELERVFHSLLITEAVLKLSERFTIWGIQNEEYLKSRANNDAGLDAKTVGDFSVFVEERDSRGELTFFDEVCGEVTVQADREQIESKPEDLWYFVPDVRTGDLVESVTGRPAVRLSDVALPSTGNRLVRDAFNSVSDSKRPDLGEQKQKFRESVTVKTGGLNELQQFILTTINNYGPLTTEAIAVLVRRRRPQISTELQDLVKRNLLRSEDAQRAPGSQMGRPKRLFGCPDMDMNSLNMRSFHLLLSVLLEQSVRKGWQVCSYSTAFRCLMLKPAAPNRHTKLALIVDDTRFSAGEIVDLYDLFVRERAGGNMRICIVPSTKERQKELQKLRTKLPCFGL